MSDEDDQMAMVYQVYEDFWREIVEDKDGNLKKEAIMVELANFYWLMRQSSTVYALITGGRLTTPNHTAQEVIMEAHNFFEVKGREVLNNLEAEHQKELNLLRQENITLLETTWHS